MVVHQQLVFELETYTRILLIQKNVMLFNPLLLIPTTDPTTETRKQLLRRLGYRFSRDVQYVHPFSNQ
jgi:hypothetical protein